MKIFGPLYDVAIRWSRHRRAPALLTGLSFVEGFIFPVPPEVMLAPMSLAEPKRSLWFATLSLLGSICGALVGYLLGHFAFAALQPLIEWLGWSAKIQQQIETLRTLVADSPWKAFWALVLSGSPDSAEDLHLGLGVVGVPILPFIASMLVGRGKRVYLVAGAIRLGGARAEAALHRWIEPLGWVAMAVLAVGAGWLVWKTTNG